MDGKRSDWLEVNVTTAKNNCLVCFILNMWTDLTNDMKTKGQDVKIKIIGAGKPFNLGILD